MKKPAQKPRSPKRSAKAVEGEALRAYFEDKIRDVKETIFAASCSGKLHWEGLKIEEDMDLQKLARHPDAAIAAAFLAGMAFVLDMAR